MITSGILYMIYGVVWLIVSPILLLPDVSISSGFSTALTTAISYISVFDSILPITTLFIIIGLIMGIEIAIAVYKIIMWVIRRIPTQS